MTIFLQGSLTLDISDVSKDTWFRVTSQNLFTAISIIAVHVGKNGEGVEVVSEAVWQHFPFIHDNAMDVKFYKYDGTPPAYCFGLKSIKRNIGKMGLNLSKFLTYQTLHILNVFYL